MLNCNILTLLSLLFTSNEIAAIRLNKLLSFLNGANLDNQLKGHLHIGNEYAVFVRAPKLNDDILTYELYESVNTDETQDFKPRVLAVSEVPVQYLKDQLKIFRDELFEAKYINNNVVPGTRVRTLREWQIDNALKGSKQRSLSFSDPNKGLKSYV